LTENKIIWQHNINLRPRSLIMQYKWSTRHWATSRESSPLPPFTCALLDRLWLTARARGRSNLVELAIRSRHKAAFQKLHTESLAHTRVRVASHGPGGRAGQNTRAGFGRAGGAGGSMAGKVVQLPFGGNGTPETQPTNLHYTLRSTTHLLSQIPPCAFIPM